MLETENKIDEIIAAINRLSDEEKRELTIKVRTTTEGIKAYTSFLYGVTSFATQNPTNEDPIYCEDPVHGNDLPSDTGEESSETNDMEEWL